MINRPALIGIALAILSGGLSILTTLVVARHYGESLYSLMAFGLAIGGFFAPLANMASDRTLVRDLSCRADEAGRRQLIAGNLGGRLVISAAILLGVGVFALAHEASWKEAIAVFSMGLWAILQALYPYSLYDYERKTLLHNKLILLERVLTVFLVTLFLFARTGINEFWAVPVMLALMRLLSVYGQYVVWERVGQKRILDARLIFSAVGKADFSGSLVLVQISSAAVGYLSQIYLGMSPKRSELASYAIVFQIVSFVLVFQSQAIRFVINEISDVSVRQMDRLRTMTWNLWVMGAVSLLLGGTLLAVIFLLLPLFSSYGFSGVAEVAVPLCLWVVVVGVGLIAGQYMITMRLEKAYLRINVSGAVVMAALGWWLVPENGATAAAYLLLTVHGAMVAALVSVCMSRVRRSEESQVI